MIRYDVSWHDLERNIEAEKRGWLQRAKERTDQFRTKKKCEEDSSIWSEVKAVYMRLQGESKCAYCERKLEAIDYGKVEQDVEHFRPKGNVKAWRLPKSLKDAGITCADVPGSGMGYYLLPYHPLNYAAACKPCNSVLKKDYFRIAGHYDLHNEDPISLPDELPYLVYPIGNFDDDPEEIIRFIGLSPCPGAPTGYKRHRALVTIEFFKLDDVNLRKNLFRERALVIISLLPQLEKMNETGSVAEKDRSRQLVEAFTSYTAPHTNCARSFQRLFEAVPEQAREFYNNAIDFVLSIS